MSNVEIPHSHLTPTPHHCPLLFLVAAAPVGFRLARGRCGRFTERHIASHAPLHQGLLLWRAQVLEHWTSHRCMPQYTRVQSDGELVVQRSALPCTTCGTLGRQCAQSSASGTTCRAPPANGGSEGEIESGAGHFFDPALLPDGHNSWHINSNVDSRTFYQILRKFFFSIFLVSCVKDYLAKLELCLKVSMIRKSSPGKTQKPGTIPLN